METVSVPSSTLCLTSGVVNEDIVFWTERDCTRKLQNLLSIVYFQHSLFMGVFRVGYM